MPTKNKANPVIFKSVLNSKIREKHKNSKQLKNITDNYNYKEVKKSQKISKYQNIFRSKINNILSGIFWKIIWKNLKQTIDLKINSASREYYSKAKDILKTQDITIQELNKQEEYFGLCLYNDIKNENFYKLNSFDLDLLVNYICKNFRTEYDLEYLLNLINVFYKDDSDKKYELIFDIVKNLDEESDYQNWNFRDYKLVFKLLSKLWLENQDKNLNIVLKIISIKKWDVDFDFLDFNLINKSPYCEQILTLLDWFDKLYLISSHFDKFNILTQEQRYNYALRISNRGSFLSKNLEKFNISNKSYLSRLAKINSWVESVSENNWSNVDFFNYEYKYDQEFSDFKSSIYNSVSYYSKLIYEDFWVSSNQKLSFLCEYIMQYCVFDEKNLEWFLKIINEKFVEDYDYNFDKLAFWLSKNNNLNRVFSRIELLWGIDKELILKLKKTIIKYLVLNKWVNKSLIELSTPPKWENDDLWFFLRKDIDLFVEFLLEYNYISSDVKDAIFSENDSFENIKNYILTIFEESLWKPILNKNHEFWIYKRNKSKVLSRELFFEPLNINFPKGNNNYNSTKMQELYIYVLNCKKYFSKDFFDNLNISTDLFSLENFDLLHTYFKNLNILINLEVIFSWWDKFSYSWALKKLDINSIFHLIWNENYYFDWLDFSDLTLENAKKFNLILSRLTKNIFTSKLNSIDLTSNEFDNFLNKWGNIDSILLLISNKESFKELLEILSRIIYSDAKNDFSNYKYNWFTGDFSDVSEANKQIWFLSDKQKSQWINNDYLLTYYSPDSQIKTSNKVEDLSSKIKKSLIDNKHLDELKPNYAKKIDNLNISLNDSNFISDLTKITKIQDLLKKYQNLDDEHILNLAFYWLVNSLKNEDIKIIINFIKRFCNKIWFELWNILTELNIYLNNISKINTKDFKSSFIFTTEVDNPKVLLEIWWLVPNDYSCQNIKNNSSQLIALPWYVVDAWVKAVVSFEITFEYFENKSDFEKFKNEIELWNYVLSFNPYNLELKINNYCFVFNNAISRNILKLWHERYSNTPSLFLEKNYSSLNWDSQKKLFIWSLHAKLLKNKITLLNAKSPTNDSVFMSSRNPFWIYADINNWIEKRDYKLKNLP